MFQISLIRKHAFPAFLALLLILWRIPVSTGQSPALPPRDLDKLLPRAQQYWAWVVAGKKTEALQFVLPDKRDFFISGDPLPVVEARIVGFDLTESRDTATVRVAVRVLVPGMMAPSSWTLNDRWLWRGSNWYADVASPRDLWAVFSGEISEAEIQKTAKEISAELKGIPAGLDLGRLIKGGQREFDLPLEYSGKRELQVDFAPRTLVFPVTRRLSAGDTSLRAYVDATDLEGNFAVPFTIKFSSGASVAERQLTVKGNVFAPISFRQEPLGPIRKGETVTVFVKNNTAEAIPIEYVTSDLEGEQLSIPQVIEPQSEGKIVYRIQSDKPLGYVTAFFRKAVYGATEYRYDFPKVP